MEWCQELANATIVQATQDYINSSRNYYKFKQLAEKSRTNPEIIVRRPNETEKCFKARQMRHCTKTYENRVAEQEIVVKSLRSFFKGSWFKQLTSLDGTEILKKLDKELEKEGHLIWD